MTARQQSTEDRFVGELSSKLEANNIDVLRDVGAPCALLEAHFPMDSGRLDWSLVADRDESEIKKASAFYGVERNEACRFYLREQIAKNDLAGKAYWINDSIDIALVGDVLSFEAIFDSLLWPSGHIYLLAEKGDWCLNVTFEDDLYFGWALPKVLSS